MELAETNHIQRYLMTKFLDCIADSQKIESWKIFFNNSLPESHLGYASEDEYLLEQGLSLEQIVINSVKQVFPDYLEDELSGLIPELLPLLTNCKIRVLLDGNIPVYTEITVSLICSIFTFHLKLCTISTMYLVSSLMD